jgi:hypothetical protein
MPTNTYVALATAIATGSQSTITFSSIPQTYTDLVLVCSGNTVNLATALLFNNDNGTNYSRTGVRGYSSTADSFRQNAQSYLAIDASVSQPLQNAIINIQNYSNTTTRKTVLWRTNSSTGVEAMVGLWYGTIAAINRIDVISTGGTNFSAGSTFTIYGIAAEVSIAPTTTPPVSGYNLWLDSADPASFTYSSGTLVSQWNDKSGNSYHFTQGTSGYQPNRISTTRQNNYPVVTFAGDFVANASLNWGASSSTLFLVAREDKAAGTGYQNLFTTGTGASGQWGYGISDAGAGDKIGIFDILQGFTAFNFGASTANADILAFTSAGISSGSVTSNLFLNGTADSLNPRTQTSTTSAAGALLGAANTANEPFYGYICEVLLYPSQLSNTDRNSVEAYLKSKWGIA